MKIPKYPLIRIHAKDWNSYSGQVDINCEFKLSMNWLVGFLIHEDDEKLVIAAEVIDSCTPVDVRYTSVIPKECIVFRTELEQKEDSENAEFIEFKPEP